MSVVIAFKNRNGSFYGQRLAVVERSSDLELCL